MTRYLVRVYKVEIPENGKRRDDIDEATEDWLNEDRHFQYQLQGNTLAVIGEKLLARGGGRAG